MKYDELREELGNDEELLAYIEESAKKSRGAVEKAREDCFTKGTEEGKRKIWDLRCLSDLGGLRFGS